MITGNKTDSLPEVFTSTSSSPEVEDIAADEEEGGEAVVKGDPVEEREASPEVNDAVATVVTVGLVVTTGGSCVAGIEDSGSRHRAE